MLGFRAQCAAALLAAFGLSGCADLGTVTVSCGNGVVEKGEDCDQTDHTTSGSACGTVGTASQCRWICPPADITKSPPTKAVACPKGWLCGVDEICRQAPVPATWTKTTAIPQDGAHTLLVSDFDSDGIDDIVTVSPGAVTLHFSESDRTSTLGDAIIAASARPDVGVLPATTTAADGTLLPGAPSLTMDLNHGLGVFTGQTDRTLSPVNYATLSFSTGAAGHRDAFIPFVRPPLNPKPNDPSTVTALYVYNANGAVEVVPPASSPIPVGTWVDTLVGSVAVGRFSNRPCPAIAVPLNGVVGGHVKIYPGCGILDTVGYNVTLPVQLCTTCKGPVVYAVDVDNDAYDDLVVVGAGTPPQLYVAFSDGLGGFSDTPGGSANGKVSAPLALNGVTAHGSPLAIGDLNGDCIIDLVDSGNVWISNPANPPASCAPHVFDATQPYVSYTAGDASHPWTQAAIADMNSDGRPDVIVSSGDAPGVTILRGTGGLFLNAYEIVTSTAVRAFAIGDYDGDLVQDVAVVGYGDADSGGNTQDPVSISFGARSGPPTDAALVGVVPNASTVVSLVEAPISPDLVINAGVVAFRDTTDPKTNITTHDADLYLFVGNTAREIDAPYILLPNGLGAVSSTVGSGGPDVPRRSIVGAFTGRTGLGDVAVFAKPYVGCTQNVSCPSDLWILPTSAGGQMTPAGMADTTKVELLPTFLQGVDDVLLVNYGPPTGSTYDTIVMAVPDTTANVTDIYVFGDGKGDYSKSTTFQIKGFAISADSGLGALRIADVDGDGLRDLILGAPEIPATPGVGSTVSQAGLAVVYANPTLDGSRVWTAPYATFTAACAATTKVTGTVQPALDVAALPATSGAPAQPLVVVVPQGTMQVSWDASKKALKDPVCLSQMTGGVAVAVGDFDGDQIVDVAVSQADTLDVYYGDAVPAGGVDGGTP